MPRHLTELEQAAVRAALLQYVSDWSNPADKREFCRSLLDDCYFGDLAIVKFAGEPR